MIMPVRFQTQYLFAYSGMRSITTKGLVVVVTAHRVRTRSSEP